MLETDFSAFRENMKPKLSDPDIELYLVACAIVAPSQFYNWDFVKPEDFTDIFSGRVWQEISKYILEGRKPEPRSLALSIYQSSDDQKVCIDHLVAWTSNVLNASNGDEYARIVKDLADRRKIAQAAKEIIAMAENTACGCNAAEIAALGVTQIAYTQNESADFVPVYTVGHSIIKSLAVTTPCFPTWFPRLDEALGGGFYRNRFYGIGARMKAGKSLLMSSIAYQMAIKGTARILYLCLEMGSEETAQRILAMHMGVNAIHFLKPSIRSKPWFETNVRNAVESIKPSQLYFRSKPRMNLDDLKSTIARAGMSGKVDGVIVDYMQLVEGKGKNQSSSEHYDNVAQTLAEAVKRYPIWILSAAQLNRDGNIRGSDGLLMACDLAFSLNKKEGAVFHDGQKNPDRAWLETMVSRYTPYLDIGSESAPGYEIDVGAGPIFRELDP